MAEKPFRWLELRVRAPEDPVRRDLLTDRLVRLCGGAVQEEGDVLITYVVPRADPEAYVHELSERLHERLPGEAEIQIRWSRRTGRDWLGSWRRSIRPRRVGRRIVVAPPWSELEHAVADVVIRIEPGAAFGTAEHASTRGALRLLERAVRRHDRVLDAGTGSGILAIAAAMLGAGDVMALDADPDAARTARENAKRNGVASSVRTARRAVDEKWLNTYGPAAFDVIAANILSGVLVPLVPAFTRALRPGGRLILGGILEEEASAVRTAAAKTRLWFAGDDHEEEWWTGLFMIPDPD